MEIREAGLQDIDELHSLGEFVEEFDTTEEVVTFWPKYILKSVIDSDCDWIYLAKAEGKITGFTVVSYSPAFRKALIENIFVSPDNRRLGVGRRLLESVIGKLRSVGCEYVCILTERSDERSIGFYRKNGFNRGKDFAWMDMVLGEGFSKTDPS